EGDDQVQRRQDAPRASLIEIHDREPAPRRLARDDRGDEIAADDEEDVDADEPAPDEPEAGVEQDDRHDGPEPEPVDLAPVFHAGPRGRSPRPRLRAGTAVDRPRARDARTDPSAFDRAGARVIVGEASGAGDGPRPRPSALPRGPSPRVPDF